MSEMTLERVSDSLIALAKVIRQHGTCAPMALEKLASDIKAHLTSAPVQVTDEEMDRCERLLTACTCINDYKSRDRVDPECDACNLGSEVIDTFREMRAVLWQVMPLGVSDHRVIRACEAYNKKLDSFGLQAMDEHGLQYASIPCMRAALESARLAQPVVAKVPDYEDAERFAETYTLDSGRGGLFLDSVLVALRAITSQPHPQAAQGGESQGED